MNPILAMMGGRTNGKAVMMQALGAMMRGESAEDFMKNLAKTNPQLQGLDLNNLEGTAHKLSAEKGIDEEALKQKIITEFS